MTLPQRTDPGRLVLNKQVLPRATRQGTCCPGAACPPPPSARCLWPTAGDAQQTTTSGGKLDEMTSKVSSNSVFKFLMSLQILRGRKRCCELWLFCPRNFLRHCRCRQRGLWRQARSNGRARLPRHRRHQCPHCPSPCPKSPSKGSRMLPPKAAGVGRMPWWPWWVMRYARHCWLLGHSLGF